MNKVLVHQDGFSNIILPREGDAGYDLIAASDPVIKRNYIEYDTGVRIEPLDKNVHGFVFPRSSISKTNLVFCNSVATIDNGYRGNIKLRFRYIFDKFDIYDIVLGIQDDFAKFISKESFLDEDKIYRKGDKIGQLIFLEPRQIDLLEAHTLSETERADRGFGSTGK